MLQHTRTELGSRELTEVNIQKTLLPTPRMGDLDSRELTANWSLIPIIGRLLIHFPDLARTSSTRSSRFSRKR